MKAAIPEITTNLHRINIESDILPDITIVEQEIEKILTSGQGSIFKMSQHIFKAGGKRIRPLLVLYCGLAFKSKITPELVRAAVAIELVHMASLVHDDIIDESALRRNKPSVNKIWGNHAAVLCGDFLFAKAFSLLAGHGLIRNLEIMVEAIQSMCHGEIIQGENRFKLNLDLENYYERIAKKTAILLQCACKSGAIVGGADENQIELIGEYGLHLGFAYQIVDDVLDFCGDSRVMGKPKREDLVQGNLTLPIILLLRHPKYSGWIEGIILQRDFEPKNLEKIENVLKETGIIKKSFEIVLSHIEKAQYNLNFLPESQPKRFLANLADKLQSRTY